MPVSELKRCQFGQVSLDSESETKVNPMPCKFALFRSVNNVSNESGYFSAFDHTSLQ